jgi:hypothetical protein
MELTVGLDFMLTEKLWVTGHYTPIGDGPSQFTVTEISARRADNGDPMDLMPLFTSDDRAQIATQVVNHVECVPEDVNALD